MKGGRAGGFSRTFNIFFFIHCTGVCLYRILIAEKKQFLVSAVKITFLDPVGSLVSTLLVVGCGWVTLFQNLFILSVVVL